MKSKTELQLRLAALAEERVQLKKQLQSARMEACLAGEAKSAAVLKILRRLDCVKQGIYSTRQRIRCPAEYEAELKRRRQRAYDKNKRAIRENQKEYYQLNASRIAAHAKQRCAERAELRNSDPEFIRQRDERRRLKSEVSQVRKREIKRAWNSTHKDSIRAYKAEHYRKNCEKIKAKVRSHGAEYRKRPEVRERLREKERIARENPEFAIRQSLRCRMRSALRDHGTYKRETTETLLGCTIQEFCRHIESRFQPGMSWDNRSEWHLDHIRPCVKFDLTDPAQQRECFHFSNIQPLWVLDNLRKGAK